MGQESKTFKAELADYKQWGSSMVAHCGELETLWDNWSIMRKSCSARLVDANGVWCPNSKKRVGEGPSVPDDGA